MAELTADDLAEIEALCPGGVTQDVNLAMVSQWRIGGRARVIIRPSTVAQVAALRRFFQQRGLAHVVIGQTSNLLFADEGLKVPCLQIGPALSGLRIEGTVVHAEAGIWVPGLARWLMQAGLSGGEHICGIPGTLGGLICMNGGSQRKGIGNRVIAVESVDRDGNICHRQVEACGFHYRSSIYQGNDEVITAVTFGFERKASAEIRAEMRAILANRRQKFPRKQPNCGSVFKSNPVMYSEIGPPGAAIEQLGMKGLRVGGAQVSPQHANFIVNVGGARAADVIALVMRISEAVFAATGYRMDAEVRYVTTEGQMLAVDQVHLGEAA